MSLLNQVNALATRASEIAKLRAIVTSAARVLTANGVPCQVVFGKGAKPAARRGVQLSAPPAASRKRKVTRVRKRSDGSFEAYDDFVDVDEENGDLRDGAQLRDADEGDTPIDDQGDPLPLGVSNPAMLDARGRAGIR